LTANIVTKRQACARHCAYTYWRNHGPVDTGDVRRCEHGKVWVATGRQRESIYFHVLDEWERLGWWTPIAYRRAVRALEATK